MVSNSLGLVASFLLLSVACGYRHIVASLVDVLCTKPQWIAVYKASYFRCCCPNTQRSFSLHFIGFRPPMDERRRITRSTTRRTADNAPPPVDPLPPVDNVLAPTVPLPTGNNAPRPAVPLPPSLINSRTLKGRQLTLLIAILHAFSDENEIRLRIDPNFDDRAILQEVISRYESIWYEVGNHQLVNTLSSVRDYRCTVLPQHAIRRLVHDDRDDQDIFEARVPDFCVARFEIERSSAGITVKSSCIVLLLEMKRSPLDETEFGSLAREAWAQVIEQAQFLFARYPRQTAVGTMISVGCVWGFKVINRADVPALSGNVDTSFTNQDLADTSYSTIDSDDRGWLPAPHQLPSAPREFYTFGSQESNVQQSRMYEIIKELSPQV